MFMSEQSASLASCHASIRRHVAHADTQLHVQRALGSGAHPPDGVVLRVDQDDLVVLVRRVLRTACGLTKQSRGGRPWSKAIMKTSNFDADNMFMSGTTAPQAMRRRGPPG